MTVGLRVRLAEPAELEAVGALTVRAYTHDGGLHPEDRYALILADAADRAARAELYVAELDGRIVGTVTVAEHGTPYAEISQPGELEFRMLAVDPEAAGRRIGSALVEFVADEARRRGRRCVVISVVRGNAAAEHLYGRLGFVRVPSRDWEPVPGVFLQVSTLDV